MSGIWPCDVVSPDHGVFCVRDMCIRVGRLTFTYMVVTTQFGGGCWLTLRVSRDVNGLDTHHLTPPKCQPTRVM